MNPIELSQEIVETYRRYLKTTFYFKDPKLRRSFEEALNSGHLSKGPFLEAAPIFKRGKTLYSLFMELRGFPLDRAVVDALDGDRPLYWHQEQAIRRVMNQRNVVVATGTGSGKTESFLYPILLHLYQEFQAGTLCPGVRALILYPMNALVNDQRDRLRDICKRLKEANASFHFTFGQYIGETPDNARDSRRHAQDYIQEREERGTTLFSEAGDVIHGEMVLRSEIRNSPPHILLTNYSMLEYLLLRPDDSPLFDNGNGRSWTFLVLDEAHQYRGSRGIEMAMLLRRIKQRIREGGRSAPLHCIATSATLVDNEKGRTAVAQFGKDLFGEPFNEEDVIFGQTESSLQPGTESLTADDYKVLHRFLEQPTAEARNYVDALAHRLGVSSLPQDGDPKEMVGALLQRDLRVTNLSNYITKNPKEFEEVAKKVFGDLSEERRVDALTGLVELLVQAKDPVSKAPLLSTRYHTFVRSLEGAFMAAPNPDERKVFLDRKAIGEEGTAFEVALCRECGQHYFVVQKDFSTGRVREPVRDVGDINFGATFLRPLESDMQADEEEDEESGRRPQTFALCLQCGKASSSAPNCGHTNIITVVKEDPPTAEERADQLERCGACGYTGGGRDPVREVVHGTDGPHSVIATTLYKELPESRKKILAFADGRQEAAFFAWYLEDSYKDLFNRNLILKAARKLYPHTSEGLTLREIAHELLSLFEEKQVFPSSMGSIDKRREAWLALYREFLTEEVRISLQGVGLIRWSIKLPRSFEIPPVLLNPPLSLTEQEARDLIFLLLDTMRGDKAVELRSDEGVSLTWDALNLQGAQTRYRIGGADRERNICSWDSKNCKRAKFLIKLLLRKNIPEQMARGQAGRILGEIWEAIGNYDAENMSSSPILCRANDARRLNPDWWRLHVIQPNETIFQCETCGRLQTVSVQDICARPGCPGRLRPVNVSQLEENHYRQLYEEQLPGILRVEEHTAQLDKDKAQEFQRDFREGKIHILSCSTTFELGVDLGDLDTIFLRNVPPEAFNYIQRVGRAGRRMGHPGFAITFCRRSPHDLYHFAKPEQMLIGKVRPPILILHNEKIVLRHITAVALSSFFRHYPQRFVSTSNLFSDLNQPQGTSDFMAFLHNNRRALESALTNIVPEDMAAKVGLDDGSWIDRIAGENSRFALAEIEIMSDYRNIKKLEREALEKPRPDYGTARWAQARATTIEQEEALSFLSRKAVIPKYGFPVDVVELDTQKAQNSQEDYGILFQRDLRIAISEFAPTSKLIANKREWTSYGLKRVAEKEWPRKSYMICPRHNVFYQFETGNEHSDAPCGCRLSKRKYIIPQFGFVTDRSKPGKPTGRSARLFTTRPYFDKLHGSAPDPILLPTPQNRLIVVTKASPGSMVVLCEGRRGEGFYICPQCGSGFRERPRKHKSAYGQDCNGTLEALSLGHEFVTDILQIQFRSGPQTQIEPLWLAFGLAYALVEGTAEVLAVPSTDLSVTVAYDANSPVPPIIIYDDVPGGAGLVAQLENRDVFRACLEAARDRVNGDCGCDVGTSCYGCLRNYRNQFAHQELQRGPVLGYLNNILSQWE